MEYVEGTVANGELLSYKPIKRLTAKELFQIVDDLMTEKAYNYQTKLNYAPIQLLYL
jgi:hypothetical protein